MSAKSKEIRGKVHIVPSTETSPIQRANWERLWTILLKEEQDKAIKALGQK